MASAKRLMELRQVCRSSSRMAEISVPAWPIPIHQTKLTMAKPHAHGNVDAPDADALEEQIPDGEKQHHHQREGDAKTEEPPIRSGTGQHDRADFFGNGGKGVTRLDDWSLRRFVDRSCFPNSLSSEDGVSRRATLRLPQARCSGTQLLPAFRSLICSSMFSCCAALARARPCFPVRIGIGSAKYVVRGRVLRSPSRL